MSSATNRHRARRIQLTWCWNCRGKPIASQDANVPVAKHNVRFPSWLWPGVAAASMIAFVAIAAFSSLWNYAAVKPWHVLLTDPYLWHVVTFTFIQALLSALCSTLPAVALARALYRRQFPGRAMLLRFCSITFVLPVLVVVFGIISVFGQQGWLAQLCCELHLEYGFSLYGMRGILLGHIFFNLPLATRLLFQALDSIPVEQRQIAAQLSMSAGPFFRLIEWPYLRRQLLPAIALIFMLCFASFATVLTLGGGPQATTIELAIYQALIYDFDIGRAALLALMQMICCLGLLILSQRIVGSLSIGHSHYACWRDRHMAQSGKFCDGIIILAALLLLLPPLLAVVIGGLNDNLLKVLNQIALWQAVFTSLFIAFFAGMLCLLLTVMLLWSSRELRLRQHCLVAQLLNLSGMVTLTMPSIVMATGFFLLAIDSGGLPVSSPALVIIMINALMAIPYTLKVLESPMQDVAERCRKLCLMLNITGFERLRLVEWRVLRQPAGQALVLASLLSLGDFGVIALFGSEDFYTLPLYLYQQIGSYRNKDGAVTALVLLLFCLLLFTLFEILSSSHDKAG